MFEGFAFYTHDGVLKSPTGVGLAGSKDGQRWQGLVDYCQTALKSKTILKWFVVHIKCEQGEAPQCQIVEYHETEAPKVQELNVKAKPTYRQKKAILGAAPSITMSTASLHQLLNESL